MRREDIIAFARREWDLVAEMKERVATALKSGGDALEALAVVEMLRRDVRERRAGWPSDADRRDDLLNHVRVSDRLGRVRRRRHS